MADERRGAAAQHWSTAQRLSARFSATAAAGGGDGGGDDDDIAQAPCWKLRDYRRSVFLFSESNRLRRFCLWLGTLCVCRQRL